MPGIRSQEFFLETFLRQTVAVYLHEGIDRPPGILMQEPGENRLSAARRSHEENGIVHHGYASDLFHDPLHCRTSGNDAAARRRTAGILSYMNLFHEVAHVAVNTMDRNDFNFKKALSSRNELSLG